MTSYADALTEFYHGEVLGEAAYSALLATTQEPDERLKWGTLLQLETETKAWLRRYLVAAGVDIEEPEGKRTEGAAVATQIGGLSWTDKMRGLHDALDRRVVPLYQGFADAAKARGAADEEAVCLFMVEHEKAQVAFARRELDGQSDRSLEPVVKFLKYPIS
jgi:hypothetical protein